MAQLRLTPADGFVPAKSKKQPFQPKESLSQAALFSWAQWARTKYPDLDLLFCVPNGVPLHGPQRFAIVNWMKAQGLKPGVPDICLPVARGGYFSKWLEMKVRGGKLSPFQEIWIDNLRRAGASVSVCESFEQAVADLEVYCQLPPTVVAA
jgi:VRR-NUC domain